MTSPQLIILAFLGILFCISLSAFIKLAFAQNDPLPTHFPTLPIQNTVLPSDTPTITQTPTPTSTPTATATNTLEPTFTPTRGVAQPPDTSENIHVALISNHYIENPQDEAGIVDLVWASRFPSQPDGMYNLLYYPFDRDADEGTGGLHHDIAYFLANHPDWIVYTCDRKTPAYEFDNSKVPLDITNPDVLDYIVLNYIVPAIQKGYQGIAFDNVGFYNNWHRCGVWSNGKWVEQPNYVESILTWASFMYTRLHGFYLSVAMNFPYDFNHPVESNQMYQYMDIVLDERGFTNWGESQENYLSGDTWLTNMQALQSLEAMGKGFISINQMPEVFNLVSQKEKQWALANYLLVKSNLSFIAITGIQEYGRILTTPEYSAPIGYALNSMYQSQGVYMRDFSNGLVIVNPYARQSFTISLPAGIYQDLYGTFLDAITLEPQSGIVLLGSTVSASSISSIPGYSSLILPRSQSRLFP
jgi:hypothetical protein